MAKVIISTSRGAFPQQLEHEGIGHIVGSVGEIVGPTAFSSLVARWDSLDSDMVKAVTRAYRASREWVNTADPMEVAEAEEPFFPGMAVEADGGGCGLLPKIRELGWGYRDSEGSVRVGVECV